MAPFFANRSCDVWTPREWPCEMGNYVEYSVNVSEPAHISKCIAFAKERNIRLVIRNTGHEYVIHPFLPVSINVNVPRLC